MSENQPPDEDWAVTIVAVARATARRFPMVDWEDVAQELRLWWISTPRVAKYLETVTGEEEDAARIASKKLMRALQMEASSYCQQEKAAALGYRVDDLFFYSTAALREILPMVYEYDAWLTIAQRGAEDGGTRSPAAPAEGNNLVAALADVSRAVSRLREADVTLLLQLYRDGLEEEDVASEAGVGLEALRKRHDRALLRLRDVLGGERPPFHEGPGSRKVLSRAAAVAQTGADL